MIKRITFAVIAVFVAWSVLGFILTSYAGRVGHSQ